MTTPLPDWVTSNRLVTQSEVAGEAVEAFKSGKRMVVLQGPTGTGKSLIGELVRRMLGSDALYTCTTKTLQDQIARAFEYSKVLKGRANYDTLSGPLDLSGKPWARPYSEITCADCTSSQPGDPCAWCDPTSACPYRRARAAAQNAELAVLNTSYLLTTLANPKSKFAGRNLCILDEADLLEDELLSHIEVYISPKMMDKLGLDYPARKTVASSWLEWVTDEAEPKLKDVVAHHPGSSYNASPVLRREYERLGNLYGKVIRLKEELPEGGWIYDGYERGVVRFQPVTVSRWGARFLWERQKRFLLMSASIISPDSLLEDVGWEEDWHFIDVPMTYDAANRPIHVVSVANMTHRTKDEEWPKMVQGIEGVLALHPNDRVLVHTVSYQLAQYLADRLAHFQWETPTRQVYTYSNAREREYALTRYKQHPGSILLAPSLDRGIDLPHDLCRVQIIAKVPYPNLGDKRINERSAHGKRPWYKIQTIRTIVQMTGRAVRSDDDYAETYILDSQFSRNIYKDSRHLFPQWWKDAVDTQFPYHRLMEAGR